jgi:hypothetical protein
VVDIFTIDFTVTFNPSSVILSQHGAAVAPTHEDKRKLQVIRL